jgi:hypothetical protein
VKAPLQIAFLTGQSDRCGAALSPAQAAFLDALPGAAVKVRVNFPYPAATPPYRPTPLARASWNNMTQYLASRSATFAQRHRPGVLALVERAEVTVFLAGSCGLGLLANLDLPASALARVRVFAYGPVARRLPACGLRRVRGRRDWIARFWTPHPDALVACGHLGYLGDAEVQELCAAYVRETRSTA